MLRCGLVSYLFFVLTAGPWFCCCTANQLTDQFTSLAAIENDDVESHSCCQNRPQSCDNSRSESDPSKSPASPQPNQCPCDENRAEFVDKVTPGAENVRSSQQGAWVHLVAVFADLSALQNDGVSDNSALARNYLSHFRIGTTQRLLNILQTYRC